MIKDHAHGIEYFRELAIEPLKHTFHSLDIHPGVKAAVAVVFAPLLTFLDEDHSAVKVMVILVGLDLLSGAFRAMKAGKFVSSKLRNTVWKVLAYLLIVIALHLIESVHPAFEALKLDSIAILYLSATEALSIIENATGISGVELPDRIKKLIEYIGKSKRD